MRRSAAASEVGQATVAGLGIALLAVVLGVLVVSAGRVYIAQAELQQAADIAAAVLATPAGDDPATHARSLARANGARTMRVEEAGDARRVIVRAPAPRLALGPSRTLEARAWVPASTFNGTTTAGHASGGHPGEYRGPLVRVDHAVVCPRVATAYRSMQRAAAASGVTLVATSGYRSVAEQSRLYAQLGAGIAAPPGASLHHAATELDISVGPAGSPAHRWLSMHGPRFGFIQRYSWEPWHWGFVAGC